MSRNSRAALALVLLLIFVGVIVWQSCGLYTVPPIGALPEGRTLFVRRAEGEPFFNSPDGLCLRRTGDVTLLCRAMAMGQAPTDRIVFRLPYLEFAYKASLDRGDR